MEKDPYRKVLTILAAKRGSSEAEAEREIQNAIEGIFDCMDEETKSKWYAFFGKEEKPEAEEVITCIAELLSDVKKEKK